MINYWISKNAFSSLKVTLTAIFQKRNFMARVFCIHCCIVDKSFLFSFFFCKLQFWGLQGPLFREIWKKKKLIFNNVLIILITFCFFYQKSLDLLTFLDIPISIKKSIFNCLHLVLTLHNVRLLNQGAIGNTLY